MLIDQSLYASSFFTYIVLWYSQQPYKINNIITQILFALVK